MAQSNGQGYGTTNSEERLPSGAAVIGPPVYPGERPYTGYRPSAAPERPIGEMFQELGQDISNLVSLEIALAKTELSEKAGQAGKAAGFTAAGGFVIYAGFLAIVGAIIALVANFLPLWVSALIVGVVVALIGYALVRKGMNDLKPEKLAPQQTLDSLKEDKEWAQHLAR